MNDVRRINLLSSLTTAMSDWLEKVGDDEKTALAMPWLGDSAAACMAHAAFAVLVGIGDAQDYMSNEGMLRDDT